MKQKYIQSLETESKNIQKSLNSSVKTQEQTKAELEKAKSDAEAKQQQIKALQEEVGKLQAKKQQSLAFLTPTASASGGGGDVEGTIRKWAATNGIDGNWAVRIAKCESGFNVLAHNASGATGLFQFMPATFKGNGGVDIYSADDQSRVATYMLAHGQAHQWVCK